MTTDDLMSATSHSITRMIQRLREEDPDAIDEIWQRYFSRLIPLARARLKALSDRPTDEEDILVSVFDRFFRAAQENRFARLENRDDLWQILLMLTERKVADQYRAATTQKRGGVDAGRQICDQSAADIRNLADQEPGPEFVATFNDNLARALNRLADASTREVATMRMEGFQNSEIAVSLGISLSSVERKLRVIREVWHEQFAE